MPCFPCGKKEKEVAAPTYIDDNGLYEIKPSELFRLNEEKDMEGLKAVGGTAGLAKALHSDLKSGLDPAAQGAASVDEHRRVFGKNAYKQVKPKNLFQLAWENAQDPIILLLVAAALVSTVLGSVLEEQRIHNEWIEGVAIWIAVIIVIFVGAGNDYQKDQQFRKLNDVKDTIEVKVKRGRETVMVKNTEVVVGDLLCLDTGDKVIADGIMIDGFHLVIDEASLTGESDPIKKNLEEDPWCRSGTEVSEGSGTILVVAVGEQSEWGKTLALVGEAGSEETPLQEKLADMAAAIGKVGLGVAVACFIALLIKWCVANKGFPVSKINTNGPVQFFLYAVTIVVVAVPEGLPLAVTIALAYSMRKMMKDANFVRHLAACETMGGATAICSDKTGTLTENRMTVTEGWFSGAKIDHAPEVKELRPELLQELMMNFALNSKAFLVEHGGDLPVEFVGNRTECAFLMLMRKWGGDYKKIREDWNDKIVELYQFSSAKKMASVLVRREDRLRLYNKGAAEWVLARCTALYNEYGEVVPMTDAVREQLMNVVVETASRGLRCICLTYADYDLKDPSRPADFFEDSDRVDRNLICCAIVGIKDPVRAEVPEAVRVCQKAGLTIRMVTGDNIHTARHIARECGILTEGGIALEGPTFRNMAAADLIPILPKLQVLARSSPEDKLTLVKLLKNEGEVVAVTGDGTNDAPALKESDVGLAMGIAGTEVAKEAADIVIMDDNFSSIVKSVLWGRSVYNSIRKFLQFQLTVNFVALVVAFVGAVAGGRIPLNVLQLLWVNLIMDTMGALALATETPNPDLLNDKPHGRDEPLISNKMWKHILVQGLYQIAWLCFFMYGLPTIFTRYAITTQCDYITGGPTMPETNNPSFCVNYIQANGVSNANATLYCGVMQNCGFPCGGDRRNTPRCPLYPSFAANGTVVPDNQAQALCAGADGCPAADDFQKQLDYINKGHDEDGDDDWIKAASLLFNSFIFLQILNEINARRLNDEYNMFEDLHKSPIFIGVLVITVGLQVIIMQTPLAGIFKVDNLTGAEWGVSIAIGLSCVPVSVATRFISRQLAGCGWKLRLRSIASSKHRGKSGRTTSASNRVHAGESELGTPRSARGQEPQPQYNGPATTPAGTASSKKLPV